MQREEKYLRIKDVMDILRCSRTHIYNLFEAGRLKKTRIGDKAIRIKQSDLDAFKQSCEGE